MTTTKPSSAGVAFKWTLIYFIASVVLTYAIQLLNMAIDSPLKYLNYVFFIGFMFMAQKELRDKLGGFMSFGEAYMHGFLYSVFCGIISAIFIAIYLTILFPQGIDQIVAAAQAKMQEQGNVSSDQMDTALNITRKYGVLIASIGALFGLIIIGAIIAVIGAAIFNKKRTLQDIENETPDPAV